MRTCLAIVSLSGLAITSTLRIASDWSFTKVFAGNEKIIGIQNGLFAYQSGFPIQGPVRTSSSMILPQSSQVTDLQLEAMIPKAQGYGVFTDERISSIIHDVKLNMAFLVTKGKGWIPQIVSNQSGVLIQIPLYLPLLFFGLLSAYCLHHAYLRHMRNQLGLCAECGYDIRGTDSRCPECGLPIPTRRSKQRNTYGLTAHYA